MGFVAGMVVDVMVNWHDPSGINPLIATVERLQRQTKIVIVLGAVMFVLDLGWGMLEGKAFLLWLAAACWVIVALNLYIRAKNARLLCDLADMRRRARMLEAWRLPK